VRIPGAIWGAIWLLFAVLLGGIAAHLFVWRFSLASGYGLVVDFVAVASLWTGVVLLEKRFARPMSDVGVIRIPEMIRQLIERLNAPPVHEKSKLLILRVPGDEATDALSGFHLMGSFVAKTSYLFRSPFFWIVMLLLLPLVEAADFVPISIRQFIHIFVLEPPGTILFLLVLTLLLLFLALPFGRGLGLWSIPLEVSAESTPPGEWSIHNLPVQNTEEMLVGVEPQPLAHSRIYERSDAVRTLAQWMHHQCSTNST